MRLPGKTDTEIVIGIARLPVVHVQTLRVKVTNVDQVTIGRLLLLPLPIFNHQGFTLKVFPLHFIRQHPSGSAPERDK